MAQQIAAAVRARDNNSASPYTVALVGYPGSGKSVSALLLATLLEQEYGLETAVLPHDGYQYPTDMLRSFPNPEETLYRRGAPDTFDPAALVRDLDRIKLGFDEDVVAIPGFDHAAGDPEPARHVFDRRRHAVVLCEGLYLLYDKDGWKQVAKRFDYRIFIDADMEACLQRVKIRQQAIPGYTAEEVAIRTEIVDRANAWRVAQCKKRADAVVKTTIVVDTTATTPATVANTIAAATEDCTMPRTSSMLDSLQLATTTVVVEPDEAAAMMIPDVIPDADWSMDISTRRRSDSLVSDAASEQHQQQDKPEPPAASTMVGSWEPAMAEHIRQAVEQTDRRPYMAALVGIPGSGKSVSSFMLANALEEAGLPTMVMPHDGYHYPLEYLKTFPNAADYIYRRGAPDTFDPAALLRDLKRIRDSRKEEDVVITLPAFDHSRGDPEPDTHVFDRNRHQVVLCEGLYLLHNQDGWADVAAVFDWTIFLNADLEACMERVKIRNQVIPGYTPQEIAVRTEQVDRVNALTVLASKARADVIVDSIATTARPPPEEG